MYCYYKHEAKNFLTTQGVLLICEEGIYMLETQNSLFVPQTTGMGSVVMGNQTIAKPNLYCTNYHHIKHNVETCKKNESEEPTITTIETTIHASKVPRPLNYPYHICGIVGDKLMNCLKFGEMQNMFKDKGSQTTKSKPRIEVKVITT